MYKYQSLNRDPDMNLQKYAPDCKYMTEQELIENGEWMDPIIESFKNEKLDRAAIAQLCKTYACADDGRILTLPFYSLFEKKYVYLPIDFVDQIYATNGCCAGNTREEAWVHAISEIMERHANIQVLTSGKSAPKFPIEIIHKYPVAEKIIEQIRATGNYDIDIYDYSFGTGFPIVATSIINKKTHSYRVKVAADPVFEIALQRNLTELFQGVNLDSITPKTPGTILKSVTDFPTYNNIMNQLETSNGVYTADYFTDEIISDTNPTDFSDNINKNNRQLLDYALGIFKKDNRQIYVRNFSYLGFPSYRFVIPGFSEALAVKINQALPELTLADMVSKHLRQPTAAGDVDLTWMLAYSNLIKPTLGRYQQFGRIAGVPIFNCDYFLVNVTRAYASYRTGAYDDAIKYLNAAICSCDEADKEYLDCINQYVKFKKANFEENKIRAVIRKFFTAPVADRLFGNLEDGRSPYDEFLLSCDYKSCDTCRYKNHCCYENTKRIFKIIEEKYSNFENGQDESEFLLD